MVVFDEIIPRVMGFKIDQMRDLKLRQPEPSPVEKALRLWQETTHEEEMKKFAATLESKKEEAEATMARPTITHEEKLLLAHRMKRG